MVNPLRRAVNRMIEKALPDLGNVRGAVHDIGQQVAAMRDAQSYNGPGISTPLPRPPAWAGAPFGPGSPLYPAALDALQPESGRPAPRIYEYPVSWNLTGSSNRLTSWQLLRDAADGVSLFRRCIEIRKDHIGGLDWDIVIGEGAIEAAQRDEAEDRGRADLESRLRDRLSPEIDRCAAFLEEPDRANGYKFDQWLSMLLEEAFVLDAVAIYPRRTYGGDLWSLEVLDGTTIKPLLDERGGRPMAPFPAFQQILYGFPRGEFTADVAQEGGTEVIPGAYASDELIYSRRVVRVWTPYGYSAVEQALDDGDLYLKRHRWMKGEYTDGTSVDGLYTIDPAATAAQWSPDQVLQYERQWNDALAGQSAERRKVRLLPPGIMPAASGDSLTAMAEKYKPEYDLHLIKLLASHFDTTLPELGFTEAKGLGSEGYHEGQADVQHRKTRPIIKYVQGLVTAVLRKHAGMPRELEFKFLGLDDEQDPGADDVEGKRQSYGVVTLNDRRDALGKPRYDFAEADMPMIITGRGVVFLEGSSELAPPGTEIDPPKAPGAPPVPAETEPAADGSVAKVAEMAAYRRWTAKRKPGVERRPFVFEHCTSTELAGLHPAHGIDYVVKAGGVDPKAPAPPGRQWPGWAKDLAVVEHYAPLLRQALTGAISATALARTWLAHRTTATDLGVADARHWLDGQGIDLEAPLRRVLTGAWAEGWFIGERSAAAMVAGLLLTRRKDAADYVFDVKADWGNWTPGDARAARLLLDAEGRSGGLIDLLDHAGMDIASIASHRFDDLAQVLHRALAGGWSQAETAKALRSVLDNPRMARLVAATEVNRATSAASLGRYRDNNIEAKEWLSAEDQRVCAICNENEGDGPVAMDAYFSSGDDAPPGHPDCRCAIAPAFADRDQLSASGGIDIPYSFGEGVEGIGVDELAGDLGALDETEAEIEADDWLTRYDDEVGRLAEALSSGVAETQDLSSGVFGQVTMVTTDDSGAYIRKIIKREEEDLDAVRQQDAEELAAQVGRALDLQTPAVYRADDAEVIMEWMSGAPAYALTDAIQAAAEAGADGERMRLLDILISNRDRNGGNWLIAEDDVTIQPIDHGLAFQGWSAPDVVPEWPDHMLAGWAERDTWSRDAHWVDNPMSQADITELRRRLNTLGARFESLGRRGWYDAMMARLDVIGRYAKGVDKWLP